ncbi:ABC transporter ATP-binding protein [Pisciglobus halotolerans]|uniref:ATP-binding cassette, subfamily B n=1 Tax=Pisciglobus halotolerans TaxID=745365 RepID=A0A1I3C741_9LACT|nr:ABC transporter ATP-binding protein [Pisciglobus halotolerans]SFH70337.1 ATP-binding cassette, subfamily B [Pisciglobus halotolerans]
MLKLAKRMNKGMIGLAVLFMIIRTVGELYLPTLTADIIDNGVANGDIPYILKMGMYMIIVSLISIGGAVANVYVAAKESQGTGKEIRNEIYRKVSYFSRDEMDDIGTASLMTRTTNDVVQVQLIFMMMLRMVIMSPIMIIGAGYLAYQREPRMASVFLGTVPLLALLIGIIMYFAVPIFKSLQRKTDRLNLVFREGLTGVRVIRAFRKGQHEIERFDEANKDFAETAIKGQTIMAFLMPSLTLAFSLTNIFIVWIGARLISFDEMGAGNLVTFLTYAGQILMSVMMLSMVIMYYPRAQVSAARINEVLDKTSSVKDPARSQSLDKDKPASLAFEHVDFRYTGAEKLALKDIDFYAKEGQTLAIIGGTGVGKSTIANLIPRFYDVETGSIKINGTDIRDITQHKLRTLLGYAPQKALLFTGTIRENMQYGKPEATDEEIWHALDIAQASDFIKAMPKQLDAHVEQGGGNFSGGQKQRLSIARALVSKAKILIFDDSFSALDFKTDAELRQALKKETKDAVVMIIAQRISTVIDADTILVLDKGTIVGKGTHEELKASNETYQEIMKSQMREEDI